MLKLLFFGLVYALGVTGLNDFSEPERTCKTLTLQYGDEPNLVPLPKATEGRVYLPFSAHLLLPQLPSISQSSPTLKIYIGSSSNLNDARSTFYVLSLGRNEISASKVTAGGKHVAVWESLDVGGKLEEEFGRNFYIRTKVRDEYIDVGLYPGGEEGSESILTVRDEEKGSTKLTHYAYYLEGGNPGTEIKIQHHCSATLRAQCLHSSECVVYGSECPEWGLEAVCSCDEDHLMDAGTRTKCVRNPVKVGDHCKTSRECSRLDAKCRKNPALDLGREPKNRRGGSNSKEEKMTILKTCQCYPNAKVDSNGVCVEIKDRGQLDWIRLGSPDYDWQLRETNNPEGTQFKDGLPVTGLVKGDNMQMVFVQADPSQCAVSLSLEGASDFPPRSYFPLHFSRSGFRVGVLLDSDSSGPILIQMTRRGDPDVNYEPQLEALISSSEVGLNVQGQLVETESLGDDWELKGVSKTFWVGVECPHHSKPEASCVFEVGSPLLSSGKILIQTMIDNPWYNPRTMQDFSPTHVSFLPGSKEASLKIKSACSKVSEGNRCSQNQDCKDGLTCGVLSGGRRPLILEAVCLRP